jgi:hypothetical protein
MSSRSEIGRRGPSEFQVFVDQTNELLDSLQFDFSEESSDALIEALTSRIAATTQPQPQESQRRYTAPVGLRPSESLSQSRRQGSTGARSSPLLPSSLRESDLEGTVRERRGKSASIAGWTSQAPRAAKDEKGLSDHGSVAQVGADQRRLARSKTWATPSLVAEHQESIGRAATVGRAESIVANDESIGRDGASGLASQDGSVPLRTVKTSASSGAERVSIGASGKGPSVVSGSEPGGRSSAADESAASGGTNHVSIGRSGSGAKAASVGADHKSNGGSGAQAGDRPLSVDDLSDSASLAIEDGPSSPAVAGSHLSLSFEDILQRRAASVVARWQREDADLKASREDDNEPFPLPKYRTHGLKRRPSPQPLPSVDEIVFERPPVRLPPHMSKKGRELLKTRHEERLLMRKGTPTKDEPVKTVSRDRWAEFLGRQNASQSGRRRCEAELRPKKRVSRDGPVFERLFNNSRRGDLFLESP